MISRDQLKKGLTVKINPKSDRSRKLLIEGVINEILTSSNNHPHGIMVSLISGEVGRVKEIIQSSSTKTPNYQNNINDSVDLKGLIEEGENHFIEFKSSMLWSLRLSPEEIDKSNSPDLKKYGRNTSKIIIAKTISAFLNSDGGTLIIGIKENKNSKKDEIIGIESEFFKLQDQCLDGYRRFIIDSILKPFYPKNIFNHLNDYIKINFQKLNGHQICGINIAKSDKQCFLRIGNEDHLFIRVDASTREIHGEEIVNYCTKRFP